MSCEAFIPDLVDAAGNELADNRRVALEQHLASCADCRDELAALRDTTLALSTTRDEPDDLTLSGFAYRTALAAESRRDQGGVGVWERLRAIFFVAGGAVAVTIAVLMAQPEPPVKQPTAVAQQTEPPAPAATADELYLWDLYADPDEDVTELAGADATLSLDDGLAGLTDTELAELVTILGDQTQG